MATRHGLQPRIDENDHARQLVKKSVKEPAARAALGNLGNKIFNKQDNKEDTVKKAFQNVKPRVDSHWKKPVVATKPIVAVKPTTRADTLRQTVPDQPAKTTSVVVKATAQEKPVTTAKVSSVPGKITRSGKVITLRREESQVSKKTLIRLKAQKLKKSSATSSSSESIDSDGANSISSGNEMEICRPPTHSTKQIEDIDANDVGNPILLAEYVNDIYKYLNDMENRYAIRENHLEGHKEITHKMRTILVDWINEVHCQFKLETETYHMAVSIIDRYLQKVKTTPKKQLQLVGVTAMFIASKYEELFPPEIQDFVYITDDTYNKKQILEMEKQILYALDFNLGKPLPIHFLRRFSKAGKAEDPNHLLGKYLIELASIDYNLAHYKPSEIAAAALYISLTLLPLPSATSSKVWSDTLEHYTKYDIAHLRPIIQRMAEFTKKIPEQKTQSVYAKYSQTKYSRLSKSPELYGSKMDKLIAGVFSC